MTPVKCILLKLDIPVEYFIILLFNTFLLNKCSHGEHIKNNYKMQTQIKINLTVTKRLCIQYKIHNFPSHINKKIQKMLYLKQDQNSDEE